ncbi:MAG TPA: serine hydrolase domain-containing protein, partial [Candidatus Krumholzibacteria bacterium]|nr:serine hydrolase domain-containing protein [Candidatus Krumholzibacteria bacterium]
FKSRTRKPPAEKQKPDDPPPPERPPDKQHPIKKPPEPKPKPPGQPYTPPPPPPQPHERPVLPPRVCPVDPPIRQPVIGRPVATVYDVLAERMHFLEGVGFEGRVVAGWTRPVPFSGSPFIPKGDFRQVVPPYDIGGATRSNFRYATAGSGAYYDVGPVTMSFTSEAIYALIQSNRLRLSTTLGDVFPDVPEDKRWIRIDQLLAHTSGLGNTYAADGEADRDRAVKELLAQPLAYAPGAAFAYSEDGYVILAAVIEVASGETYESYLLDSGVISHAMHQTMTWDEAGYLRAEPWYSMDRDQRLAQWGRRGARGIVSTVDDLFLWAADALNRPDYRDFIQPRVAMESGMDAGFGWLWTNLDAGGQVVSTDGSGEFGHNVMIAGYPNGAVVVVASDGYSEGAPWSQRVVSELEPILLQSNGAIAPITYDSGIRLHSNAQYTRSNIVGNPGEIAR